MKGPFKIQSFAACFFQFKKTPTWSYSNSLSRFVNLKIRNFFLALVCLLPNRWFAGLWNKRTIVPDSNFSGCRLSSCSRQLVDPFSLFGLLRVDSVDDSYLYCLGLEMMFSHQKIVWKSNYGRYCSSYLNVVACTLWHATKINFITMIFCSCFLVFPWAVPQAEHTIDTLRAEDGRCFIINYWK